MKEGVTAASPTIEHITQQRQILVGQAVSRIDNQNYNVGFFNGLKSLDHAELLDCLLNLSTPAYPGGIDKRVGFAATLKRH